MQRVNFAWTMMLQNIKNSSKATHQKNTKKNYLQNDVRERTRAGEEAESSRAKIRLKKSLRRYLSCHVECRLKTSRRRRRATIFYLIPLPISIHEVISHSVDSGRWCSWNLNYGWCEERFYTLFFIFVFGIRSFPVVFGRCLCFALCVHTARRWWKWWILIFLVSGLVRQSHPSLTMTFSSVQEKKKEWNVLSEMESTPPF